MTDIAIVLTTVGADERAEQLARQLVDERLAACVNVHPPMVSLYRWKGAVERETECQIVIKTTRDRLAALEARLRELHPYELPELVVIVVASRSRSARSSARRASAGSGWASTQAQDSADCTVESVETLSATTTPPGSSFDRAISKYAL